MKKGFWIVLLSALVAGLTAFCVVKLMKPQTVEIYNTADGPQYRTVSLSHDNWPDFTYAAETAVDAVVYVKVTATETTSNPQSLLEYFFGYGTPQQRERVGSGSGVIIRHDGYIVTNNHVIEGASSIQVTLNNNQTYDAVLVGTDPATDVALLKIEAENPTRTSSNVVYPGNSGGALVDKSGNLVGINTAIISQTGSYTGYSFAVPSNIVKKIVTDLIDFGSVKRAVLGITMQEITDKIASDLKLSSRNGVYIVEVSKGGAADKAGIKAGDVLIAIDSVKITNSASVQETVSRFSPDEIAELTVIRDGKEITKTVVFKGTAQENGTESSDGSVAFYGSYIKEASKDTLEKLGIRSGVEIVDLGPGKLMDAGATEGFVIQYVNDQPVKSPQEVLDLVKKSKRIVSVEGKTPSGRTSYFAFGVE